MKKKHLKRLVRQQAYRIVALTAELDVLRRTPQGVATWPIDSNGGPVCANCCQPIRVVPPLQPLDFEHSASPAVQRPSADEESLLGRACSAWATASTTAPTYLEQLHDCDRAHLGEFGRVVGVPGSATPGGFYHGVFKGGLGGES